MANFPPDPEWDAAVKGGYALDLTKQTGSYRGDTQSLDLAQQVAPSLGIDLTLSPSTQVPDDPAKAIADKAAVDLGVDLTAHAREVDFSEAGPREQDLRAIAQPVDKANPMVSQAPQEGVPRKMGPLVPTELQSALERKASRKRTITGEGSAGDVLSTGADVAQQVGETAIGMAAGILSIPERLITAGKEMSSLPSQVEWDSGEVTYPSSDAARRAIGASADTAMTLAGARAFGAPGRGTLSVGAGPIKPPVEPPVRPNVAPEINQAATELGIPPEASFTASPPAPEIAQRAEQGLPPPGTPPPSTPGAPPPTPPGAPRAPAEFLDNPPAVTSRPMDPKRVTEMENDLFAIKSADRGRREVVQTKTLPAIGKNLARAYGRDATKIDRELYHAREAGLPIDPRAQGYNDKVIEPLKQARTAKWQELRRYNMPDLEEGVINPNQAHRMRIGKTRGLDEASGLGETVGYGRRSLSTTPSTARARTILAMEDEHGNVKVIQEHPGSDAVFRWENGKRITEPGSFIRTREARDIPGEVIPGRKTLTKPVVARVTPDQGLTDPHWTKSKQIPDRVTEDRTTEPSLVNDKFRKGSEFVDMNKKRWFVRDATTAEIHAAGVRDVSRREVAPGQFRITYGEPVRFYESALASELLSNLELDKALATARFRAKWQAAPEFKQYSVAHADATPEQRREWVQIQAPGWEGRYYDPRFAEPIIDHLTGQGYRIPIVDPASNFATSWLFKTGIGSIAHGWNEHLQRLLARGVGGNLNVVARVQTAIKALDETLNKGPIWQDYRNKGASFPSDSHHWRSVESQILKTLGMQLKKERGFHAMMKRWGLETEAGANIVEHALGKAVFEYGDFIAFQHGLELERRGFTREQAIERMNRVLPTYRIPSRIITKGKGGRAMAQAAASPGLFQFGRYTYSRFKALSSIVEDIAGKGKSFRDRADGLSRLITVVAIMAFVRPFIDKKLQDATGEKDMHFLWGGPLGMVARAVRMADDVREGRKSAVDGVMDALTSSVNLGPFIKEAIQQYTGRDLYNDRQFVAPTDPDMLNIAERASHIGSTFFAPTQAFSDPTRYFVEDPLRLSKSGTFDPRPRSMKQGKTQYMQERGRFERLPGPVQGILRYGGTQ